MSETAEILAKEMQAIVAADRWKGRDLSAAPPEKWSHLRAETQQFWIDTASRILAAIQPADLAQAKDAEIAKLRERLAALTADNEALQRKVARMRAVVNEITDPDTIWAAIDGVHDFDASLNDYAAAVSKAQRAEWEASK